MKNTHLKLTIVFATYLIAVGLIAFWPTPVDRPLAGTLAKAISWLHNHGMPKFIGYRDIEFAANIGFFIPMGAIITVWTKRPLRSVPIATYVSLSIELLQELILPQRFSSVFDIIANTLGAAIGALLIYPLATRLLERIDSHRDAKKQHEYVEPLKGMSPTDETNF